MLIKELMDAKYLNVSKSIGGWVENRRNNGEKFFFISLRDGSSVNNLQLLFNIENFSDVENYKMCYDSFSRNSSISVTGKLVKSVASGQEFDFIVTSGTLYGGIDEKYPLIKGRLPLDYLRGVPHLRTRTRTFQLLFMLRNTLQLETHNFYNNNGFYHIATPLITTNDCEGAGETFNISNTLGKDGEKRPFFGEHAHLTVSGQLHVEPYAHAFKRVYTFGPTFRAENSNTSRHLAEFWMIEPELSFINFTELIDNMESYLKYMISVVLEKHSDIIDFFDNYYEKGLKERLINYRDNSFKRVKYEDCLTYIENKIKNKKIKINPDGETKLSDNGKLTLKNPIVFGDDLGSEIEKYLVKEFGNLPLFVTHFPKSLKSFYMKTNTENSNLMDAVDFLVPNVGELMGGSMREENIDSLLSVMEEKGVPSTNLEWYLDLRRNGTVPHGGYGIGFERLIQFMTGIKNIRDTIPFPRFPGGCFA